jgi:hypothetical protein
MLAIILHQTEPQWGGEPKSLLIGCSVTKQRLGRGLPYDLDHELEDVRRKGEEVEEVSIGLDADWFLRTNARHGTFPSTPEPALPSIPSVLG